MPAIANRAASASSVWPIQRSSASAMRFHAARTPVECVRGRRDCSRHLPSSSGSRSRVSRRPKAPASSSCVIRCARSASSSTASAATAASASVSPAAQASRNAQPAASSVDALDATAGAHDERTLRRATRCPPGRRRRGSDCATRSWRSAAHRTTPSARERADAAPYARARPAQARDRGCIDWRLVASGVRLGPEPVERARRRGGKAVRRPARTPRGSPRTSAPYPTSVGWSGRFART